MLDGDPSFVSSTRRSSRTSVWTSRSSYAGSEAALLSELETAYQNEEPLLFYWYTPHWGNQKYDLTEVALPEVTEECTATASTKTGDGYACDYAAGRAVQGVQRGS